jgi:ferritin-like metal-binding protein YciE
MAISKQELSEKLEEQIGECVGLERAAQQAVKELETKGLLDKVKRPMEKMRRQAGQHEQKMEQAIQRVIEAEEIDESSIEQSAEETVQKATEMMQTYLGKDPDSQDALEFLCLAEGGEVIHYEVLSKLSQKVKDKKFASTVKTILKQEKQHLQLCTQLAKQNVVKGE